MRKYTISSQINMEVRINVKSWLDIWNVRRALMKAENFKTENLEKLSDEVKDENIDIVKKKLQEAGLY